MFPYFSGPGLVVCIGDVLPAPKVVIAILRDEAVATLSKALLISVDEIIALMGHSFGGWGQSCRTLMLKAIPFSFRMEKRYVFPAYSFPSPSSVRNSQNYTFNSYNRSNSHFQRNFRLNSRRQHVSI